MDDDDFFIFEIHFGGRFKNLNGLVYVNGDVTAHDEPFDSDCLSIFELESILGNYGYQHGDFIYYKLADMSLENGLVLVKTDADVLKMVDAHKIEKFVVLYTVSAADADDCIPLTPTLPEVLVVDKSKGKGKESGTSNKRDKLPISGGKNKNKGVTITERQPPVKGKEKEVADRSKGKGKEKIVEVSVEEEYDADDDVDCADYEPRLEVEDEVSELDLWDGLLSGDEDLLDAAVAAYTQGMASQPASQPPCETPNQPPSQPPCETANDEERVPKAPKPRSVEFDVIDMSNPVLENGMKFSDVYQFREAVREYNLKIGKDLSFVKNDKDKVIIVCKDEHCSYRVYGSQVRDEMTFQIKTYNPNHTCTRAYKNSAMNSKWISKRYMETFRHDIKKPTLALQQEIKSKWNVDVSKMQVYRARKRAAENIEGSHKEQYRKIWDYCETLKETNAATRTGFKKGCRPLIGLDGCFLKGSYKGHLLSAVARDANDNMYPICVAVVEAECKASWSWFLSTLLKDLGEVAGGWTFISDRQKGLTESFKDVCPNMDHRACVRHIYANFRDSGHRGKALKDKLWAAASAYTEFEFDAHMAELKKLSPPAYEYLSKIPVATWSRSRFTKNPKSDLIVNNLSECFNSYILDVRDKPILTMIDTIRRKLMRRFQVNRASIAKMSGKLCPKIQVKVDKAGVKASECLLLYSGEGKYEVNYRQQKFVVNLREKTCGSIEKYQKSYEPIIHPVPSMEQWTRTQYDPVDPPFERCHPGRPKRMRRRDPSEPRNPFRFSKVGTNIKCSSCKKLGHNSRTCPLAKKQKSKTGSKGKKKKSADGATGSAGDATSSAGGATSTAGATGTRSKGKKKAAGGATGATGTAGSSGTTAKGKKKSGGAGAAGTAVSGGVGGAVTADGGVGGAVTAAGTAAGGAGGAVTAAGGAVTAAGGAGGAVTAAVTAAGGAVTAAGGAVTAVRGAGTAAAGSRKAKVVVKPKWW
uniref:CCHC-type domain-containing protein n=1 Tax=Fagus sylvatica TaxID=28930 RepID=A0A2N9EU15_FAGSY